MEEKLISTKASFTISTDKSKMDLSLIYNFLTNSYWAKGRSFDDVKKSIENSYCIGVFDGEMQVGFARVVSDCVVFAYLMDVFVAEEYRGRGISKLIMDELMFNSPMKNVKKWLLATVDANGLYEKYGFGLLKNPERLMEKWNHNQP